MWKKTDISGMIKKCLFFCIFINFILFAAIGGRLYWFCMPSRMEAECRDYGIDVETLKMWEDQEAQGMLALAGWRFRESFGGKYEKETNGSGDGGVREHGAGGAGSDFIGNVWTAWEGRYLCTDRRAGGRSVWKCGCSGGAGVLLTYRCGRGTEKAGRGIRQWNRTGKAGRGTGWEHKSHPDCGGSD